METGTIISITGIILMIAGFTFVGYNDLEPTNYCLEREIKAHCFGLSSTGKTCYTLTKTTGGKRCTEGWKDIPTIFDLPQDISVEPIIKRTTGERFVCTSNGCIKEK